VAFSPAGKVLASAGLADEHVKLWDTRTWTLQAALRPTPSGPQALAFSPDGKWLAAASGDVRLWVMPEGRAAALLKGEKNFAFPLSPTAFTPNGHILAIGGNKGEIRLWETATGKVRATLKGHSAEITALAMTADGKTLASLEANFWTGGILLWDLATAKEIATLFSDSDSSFGAITFAPDCKTLVTVRNDGAIQWWDIQELRRRSDQVNAWTRSPPGVSAREAAAMRKRIAALAAVNDPDYGLPLLDSGGWAFAPVVGKQKVANVRGTDGQVKAAGAVVELVQLGPRAIPFLLEALDDKTPTGAVENLFDPMRFGRVPYTVKIGEVCYVALGQIVGRDYGPKLLSMRVKQIRATWVSDDPAKRLYQALLEDYQTRRAYTGNFRDGWNERDRSWLAGSELQTAAAMRLLYYFPSRSAPMIAERLSRLDVKAPSDRDDASTKRDVANGVRTWEFIDAVAWCKEPAIRDALLAIFKRTTDAGILRATLPALHGTSEKQIYRRVESLLDALPELDDSASGEGYTLLLCLGQCAGDAAKPAFVRYLRNASLQRRWTMCYALREMKNGAWALELLTPMLNDKRTGYGGTFAVDPEKLEPRLPMRLCDDAARTISTHYPELRFTLAGQYQDVDRQIKLMQEEIARWKR
jgi:hypothetical protein